VRRKGQRQRKRAFNSREAVYRLTVVLVFVSLLRLPAVGGLVLLHEHCEDEVHVHVSNHQSLEDWRRDHALSHPCEAERDDHHQDTVGQSSLCGHDDPIVMLMATDLATPHRRGAARHLSLQPAACVSTPPAEASRPGMEHRAPSQGRWRVDIDARSTVAAILMRNHALLL